MRVHVRQPICAHARACIHANIHAYAPPHTHPCTRSDCFSFGNLIWQLYTGKTPWGGIEGYVIGPKVGTREHVHAYARHLRPYRRTCMLRFWAENACQQPGWWGLDARLGSSTSCQNSGRLSRMTVPQWRRCHMRCTHVHRLVNDYPYVSNNSCMTVKQYSVTIKLRIMAERWLSNDLCAGSIRVGTAYLLN